MSDRLEQWFDRLRAQPPPTSFAPAEQVRRRGRRRTYRRQGAAATATLVVVGLAAVGLGQLSGLTSAVDSTPVVGPLTSSAVDPSASTGASSVTADATDRIDDSWFLATEDLGPGDWRQVSSVTRYVGGPPDWLWAVTCPGFGPADHPSLAARRDMALLGWTMEAGPDPAEGLPNLGYRPDWVHQDPSVEGRLQLVQVVDLFRSGGARQNLADIRRTVEECDPAGWNGDPTYYRIVHTGFVGDESLLITETWRDSVTLIAVVRVGDVVTSLRSYASPPALSPAGGYRLLELARTAAARLPRS